MQRRTALILLALVTSWSGLAQAQASRGRAITHEDVYLAKRLGAPAVSPDGRWVVVPVAEPAYDEKDASSDLWLFAADGSAPGRRLTATKAAESGAAWSPDGTRLAFASRREGDEAAQIYVLDLARGGDAQRVTSLSTGARQPQWRPDGGALLFVSDVFPGAADDDANRAAAAERRGRKWSARVYEGFPIRNWDRWLDDRKPSLFVQELRDGAVARDLLAGIPEAGRAGWGGQMGSGSESIAATWAGNGHIYFAATENRDQAAFADVIQSLYALDVATGTVTRMTKDNASYAAPAVHAATSALFARFEPATDRTYNASRLMRVSPRDGTRQSLTDGFDRSVGAFVVAPDGRTVYFLAEDAGRQKLFAVGAAGGAVTEVGALTLGSYSAVDIGGPVGAPVAAAVWESATNPPELVRVDLATGVTRRLSSFNTARAAEIDLPALREFWFTSSQGRRIHSFMALPPGFDAGRKYPLFVVIHGGPHGQWADQWVVRWNYHLLAEPGYIVLLTNFTGSTGFGERFAQNIQGDPLATPGQEVLEAVDEALKKYPFIDGTRLAAGGASYGGHLTNWLAVTTTRFRALVSHAGLFDQVAQWTTSDVTYGREVNMGGPVWEGSPVWQAQNPILKSAALKTPMLVTAGERDFRVPINNTLQLWSILQRQKIPSRLIVFPDENHWVLRGENSRYFYREVHAWLKRWLAPQP